MTQPKSIQQALFEARAEMEPAVKRKENPHFKSKYADLSEILNVVEPPLHKHDILLYFEPGFENEKHLIITVFWHVTSGSYLTARVPLLMDKPGMQAYKSAVTYAKRIGLESLCGIAAVDDDAEASERRGPSGPSLTVVQNAARAALERVKDRKVVENVVKKFAKNGSAKAIDVPKDQYTALIAELGKLGRSQ